MGYLDNLLDYEWAAQKGPGGAWQWLPVDASDVEFSVERIAVEPRFDFACLAGVLRLGERWKHHDSRMERHVLDRSGSEKPLSHQLCET